LIPVIGEAVEFFLEIDGLHFAPRT
jgi:hypothetical protein